MKTFKKAGLFFFAVCLLGVCGPAPAPGQSGFVEREEAKAVIEGKGPDAIFMGVHGFKYLSSNTLAVMLFPLIYDIDGKAIEFKDLKIPCEAIVSYKRSDNREAQMYKLTVKAYGPNALDRFTQGARYKVGETMVADPLEDAVPAYYTPGEGAGPNRQ